MSQPPPPRPHDPDPDELEVERRPLDRIPCGVPNAAANNVLRHPAADLLLLGPPEGAHVQKGASRGRVVDRAVRPHIGAQAGRVTAEL